MQSEKGIWSSPEDCATLGRKQAALSDGAETAMCGDGLIWHYCGVDAFKRIVERKSLFRTDLLQSNDSMEGRWYKLVLSEIREETGEPPEITARIEELIEAYLGNTTVFGVCFSEKGDLLSQWRAYADDGYGFSLGFDREKLKAINDIDVRSVIYDKRKQTEHLEALVHAIKNADEVSSAYDDAVSGNLLDESEDGSDLDVSRLEQFRSRAIEEAIRHLDACTLIKNSAFAEEMEVRAFRLVDKEPISDELVAHDGSVFYCAGKAIKPSIPMPFFQGDDCALMEVRRGPKSQTEPYVLEAMMKVNGLGDVRLSSSAASYR